MKHEPSRRGAAVRPQPGGAEEPELQEISDDEEPEHDEFPEQEEPDIRDPYADDEADSDESPEQQQPAHALVAQRSGIDRVQALLTEALRLGQQYGLIERQPDGTLLLPGQQRAPRRESSDCTCPQCQPWAQMHWWCIVCGSGPHDWLLVKPQYERQTLKPGGIEGVRQAACSAQCARDYLASMGRQPSGVQPSREVDPTLGLPG